MIRVLRRIVQEVSVAGDIEKALGLIVDRVRGAIRADVCSIYLRDPEHGCFVLLATEGLNAEAVGRVRVRYSEGLVGLSAEREEPLNLEDARTHPRFRYFPEAHEDRFRGWLSVPIVHQATVLGVLVVQHGEQRRFDEGEVAFLVTISAQLAGLIAHAEATGATRALLRTDGPSEELAIASLPGCPGVGIGTAVVLYPAADLEAVPDRPAEDVEAEILAFRQALAEAKRDIQRLADQLANVLPPEEQALFDAFLQILGSRRLEEQTIARIRAGLWAQAALREAIRSYVRVFEGSDNDYLRDRAQDLRDLGRRILAHLQARDLGHTNFPESTILVGEEITASQLMEVPAERLAGLVTVKGSCSSHVAIMARALAVPALLGVEGFPVARSQGREVIVDGYQGKVFLSPSPALREQFQRLASEERELHADLGRLRGLAAETPDGFRMCLLVNSGLFSDLTPYVESGAEGVGLFRTEMPFMMRERFPGEEEQRHLYRHVLKRFAPRPVVMRTLDVGGDKPLPYFPVSEENPFLGWRGIRMTLDHPEIFLAQVRAMLRASASLDNLRILLPMVSCVEEVREARRLIEQARAELLQEGENIAAPGVGIMIEVPSAVYQVRTLARYADFLSVGSNDLTQYLLAVDRNNARVAALYDHLHPAVLCAVRDVVAGAHQEEKPVGVCGEMGADPMGALLLLGMGVDHLSMNVPSLAKVKRVIRSFRRAEAGELLEQVLAMETKRQIRAHLAAAFERAGLGGLVRGGR